MTSVDYDHNLRRVVRLVAVLNLAYFGVEFAVARAIGSVSLFAESIDFLEDASVNFLIMAALDGAQARLCPDGTRGHPARAGSLHAMGGKACALPRYACP